MISRLRVGRLSSVVAHVCMHVCVHVCLIKFDSID